MKGKVVFHAIPLVGKGLLGIYHKAMGDELYYELLQNGRELDSDHEFKQRIVNKKIHFIDKFESDNVPCFVINTYRNLRIGLIPKKSDEEGRRLYTEIMRYHLPDEFFKI